MDLKPQTWDVTIYHATTVLSNNREINNSRDVGKHHVSIDGTHAKGNLEAASVDEHYAEENFDARDDEVLDRDMNCRMVVELSGA